MGLSVGLGVGPIMGNLNNVKVKNAPNGIHQDGNGLMLQRSDRSAKWIWRYTFAKKRRDMGLGTWPEVSLAEARKDRDRWAATLRSGHDPINTRKSEKADALARAHRNDPTFADMAKIAFDAKRAGLRGDGVRGRWFSPLGNHIIPKIGNLQMSKIHQTDIHDALKPIWKKMPPTAEKAIQRTRSVFQTAKLSGIDCDPFTVDAARHMLGHVRHEPKHLPALPWQEVPALFERLGDAPSGLCIKWLILTSVRAHAARGAHFDEIEGDVWTIPAERIKGNEGKARDFRVPLSSQAMELAGIAAKFSNGALFPSVRAGAFITDQALNKALKKRTKNCTIHGFRTSFRSWVQDTDACSWDVAETILGHTIGDKVERSYARSDLLDRRRIVLESWGDFVSGKMSGRVLTMG